MKATWKEALNLRQLQHVPNVTKEVAMVITDLVISMIVRLLGMTAFRFFPTGTHPGRVTRASGGVSGR